MDLQPQKNVNQQQLIAIAGGTIFLLLAYALFWLLPADSLRQLNREDGPVEYLGALALLLTAGYLFASYFASRQGSDLYFFRTKKNVFLLLLALLFSFGFLEEISWGQRLLHYSTPEPFAHLNRQNEVNIHNLEIFHSDEGGWRYFLNGNKLLTLFWLSFCVAIPLLNWSSSLFRGMFKRLAFPIVPLFLSSLFVVNFLFARITQQTLDVSLINPLVELKETLISLLFLLVGLWFHRRQIEPGKPDISSEEPSGNYPIRKNKRSRSPKKSAVVEAKVVEVKMT